MKTFKDVVNFYILKNDPVHIQVFNSGGQLYSLKGMRNSGSGAHTMLILENLYGLQETTDRPSDLCKPILRKLSSMTYHEKLACYNYAWNGHDIDEKKKVNHVDKAFAKDAIDWQGGNLIGNIALIQWALDNHFWLFGDEAFVSGDIIEKSLSKASHQEIELRLRIYWPHIGKMVYFDKPSIEYSKDDRLGVFFQAVGREVYAGNGIDMLFTNFKLGGDIEIWEGDVCKTSSGGVGIVSYSKETGAFRVEFGDDYFEALTEIVDKLGNVYENPDIKIG